MTLASTASHNTELATPVAVGSSASFHANISSPHSRSPSPSNSHMSPVASAPVASTLVKQAHTPDPGLREHHSKLQPHSLQNPPVQDPHYHPHPEVNRTLPSGSHAKSPVACSVSTLQCSSKAEKRSSSSSNDLLYERDRFRARLKSFNDASTTLGTTESLSEKVVEKDPCDVCDGIGYKTAKLNMVTNKPLESHSRFDFENITLNQLRELFTDYFNKPLPNALHMFPWLHGLHPDNFAQKSFFLLQQQQQSQRKLGSHDEYFMDFDISKPKNISFLMCVSDETIPVQLRNTVQLTDILQRIDVPRSEVRKIVCSIAEGEEMAELLVQDCIKLNVLPVFLNLDPDRGISLRNFQIQIAKLSTCSDFVVYGTSREQMDSIARVLWLAQKLEKNGEGKGEEEEGEQRKIYVLDDPLDELYEAIESPWSSETAPLNSFFIKARLPFANLQFINRDTSLLYDNNFQINEKFETMMMSTATKICQNVWVGNVWDHHIMIRYLREGKKVDVQEGAKNNLHNDPLNSLIHHKYQSPKELFEKLPQPKSNYKLFIQCTLEAPFPDLNELAQLLFQYSISSHENDDHGDWHHLQFPPSGSLGIGDCKRENLQSIVNTCKLIYLYSSSRSDKGLGALIYCSDGYTESALLVLCYIMYSMDIPLDEALLTLHLEFGRPFYIFSSDSVILRKLEPLLRRYSPKVKTNMEWGELEYISPMMINEILLTRSPNAIETTTRFGFIANEEDSDDSSGLSEEDGNGNDAGNDNDDEEEEERIFGGDWVKEVEGSIPSKILPYLYLGSKPHASCLPLLNKLGIKKIISVGEDLPWLNGYKFRKYNEIVLDENQGRNIEIYSIIPRARRKLHWNTTVDTVMKLSNLEDDGKDELSNQLPRILEFIDAAREEDGNTKILVHCRVGVSRSATVVIAEAVKRLQVSLPQAYLYVRVRRLNIIIQPHLRFMYEMFKWEETVKAEKKKQDGADAYHDGTCYLREIDWFIMSREIYRLNIPFVDK
ncbi:uncharacterized protein LODBEIA_P58320 [Lodderomyces beijingensis]|uniref:Protein-tyrosine-phosphatase n=1 Tax=Lodderomyces beijingensis TaxID=1775926 RepID=A0ABP0ZTZ4_9ASCO